MNRLGPFRLRTGPGRSPSTHRAVIDDMTTTSAAPRRTGPVRPVAALVVVVLAGACAERPPDPRPVATVVAGPDAFGGTDTAWTQLMIPMTAQIVTLLELTTVRAADAGLARLAGRLAADYRGDLLRLRSALTRAGLTPTNEHDGHDLPGMVTAADLEDVGRQTGADFDALVGRHLREEMEQSVRLARSEEQAGRNAECKAIAASIEQARTASLSRLNAVITP
jgi:hypothetical protein